MRWVRCGTYALDIGAVRVARSSNAPGGRDAPGRPSGAFRICDGGGVAVAGAISAAVVATEVAMMEH
jgi:hypothetical protein